MKRSEMINLLEKEFAELDYPDYYAEKALKVIEKARMEPPQAAFSRKLVINGEEQFYYKNAWEKE